MPRRPLWECPRCGRPFANRNQPHACAPLGHVDDHLAKAGPEARAAFDALVAALREIGPVRVNVEKTRIAFQVRMHFAGCVARRDHLRVSFVLPRAATSPRFLSAVAYSERNHVYEMRVETPDDVDAELKAWLAEAYACGAQEHVRRAPRRSLDAPPARGAAEGATRKPKGYMMILERAIAAPAAESTRAWVDARRRARWLTDAGLRDAVKAAWPERRQRAAPLGATWVLELAGPDAGRLEVAIAPKGEGSIFRVWHSRLPSIPKRMELKRRWLACVKTLMAQSSSEATRPRERSQARGARSRSACVPSRSSSSRSRPPRSRAPRSRAPSRRSRS